MLQGPTGVAGREVSRGLQATVCLAATYLFWGGTFLALRVPPSGPPGLR